MTPEQWKKLDALFHEALELEKEARAAHLAKVCGDDEQLREDAERLIAAHERESSFIDSPIFAETARLMEDDVIQSPVGHSIGHYKVISRLGRGGMGEVYLAEDTRLERKVALKVLPASFTQQPERVRRFEREAKAASALNHPNILTIHEIGQASTEAGGVHFIVSEFVEGETLRALIERGSLGINEAITIADQVAGALGVAHGVGIIHRDIKPENVMIRPDGLAKVLDFGLAKLTERPVSIAEADSQAETMARLSTEPGVVMGTVSYMSPEQARGQKVDQRTDIFSLGVMLYEMVAGRRPFEGATTSDVIAALLGKEPLPLTQLLPEVPAELERIVVKALRKDREERYQVVKDLLLDLKSLRQELEIAAKLKQAPGAVSSAQTVAKTAYEAAVRYWVAAGALGLVLVLLLASMFVFRRGEVAPPIRPAEYMQLTNFTDSATQPALSPDGRMLTFIRGEGTFATTGQIYVKLLPGGEPFQLTRDDFAKMSPVFSPDGSRIAYTVSVPRWAWDSWVVPVLGGEPRQLLPNASGLTWFVMNGVSRLLFSEIKGTGIHMGIVTASESRADARDVYLPPTKFGMAHRSYLSPDRRSVLVVEMDASGWLPCRVVPFDGSSAGRQVGPPGAPCTYASWSPDGQWMYLSANTGAGFHIWRQRFPEGAPEQVTFGATEEEGIAMASDGRSFVTSIGTSQSTVWIQDPAGERQISSEGYGFLPSFSSDGKKLYYLVRGSNRHFVTGELWQVKLDSGRRERLLPDFVMAHYDVSADGHRVLFSVPSTSGKFAIWIASLDRRFPPRQLVVADAERAFLTPHGEVFFTAEEGKGRYIYRIKEDGTGRQQLAADSVVILMSISPDGGWVVAWVPALGEATSNAVVAYPTAGGSPLLICGNCARGGGPKRGHTPPLVSWSHDGRYIYFSLYDKPIAVPLLPGQSFPVLPGTGVSAKKDLTSLPGALVMVREEAFPGPNPSLYAFCRTHTQRNLYRISVP